MKDRTISALIIFALLNVWVALVITTVMVFVAIATHGALAIPCLLLVALLALYTAYLLHIWEINR